MNENFHCLLKRMEEVLSLMWLRGDLEEIQTCVQRAYERLKDHVPFCTNFIHKKQC